MGSPLTFRVLGPMEVVEEGTGRRLELGGPKQRAVLALLVLRRGTVVPVPAIVHGLWGDDPPASAVGTLQAYVSNLRRVLEPDRPAGAPATTLVTEPAGYRLAIADDQVDAAVLERSLREAEAMLAAGDPDRAAELATEARALWRGPVLGELGYESFAAPEAHRLEELHVRASEVWAEAELARGRHGEVATVLPTLVAEHPLRWRLRASLMLALYRAGRQAEALRAYADGRAVLRAELGAEPEPELQALEERILLQDPVLDWRPAAGAGEPPPAVDVPAATGPVVGRDDELRRLEAAMIAASSGQGRVVLLTGDAGIGKTRLAEAVASGAAARGAVVAWGRSFEAEGAPAFWPWAEVLRSLLAQVDDLLVRVGGDVALLARLLPELADAAPAVGPSGGEGGEALRFSIYEAVTRCLRVVATDRLLVVVLDDLQWADAATMRLLQFLAGRVAGERILVVPTFRDDDVAGELADVLASMAREADVERVRLRGLDEGDVGRLLADALAVTPSDEVIADVYERSAGNPFFVGELARTIAAAADGAEPVPVGVRSVIRQRVEQLGEGAEALLTAAAVVGREFDVAVAAEVTGVDPDSDAVLDVVEAATAARLVEETPRVGRYRFAHALVQEALLGGVSGLRRARMHQRVAAVLEAATDRDRAEDLATLAFHALEGAAVGGAGAAVVHARRAASAALASLAFEDAVRLCEHALAVLDRTGSADDDLRFALELDLGTARRHVGDAEGSRRALTSAVESARRLGGEAVAAAALAYSGGVWWSSWVESGAADAGAIALLEEALACLADEPSPLRAEVLARLAVQLHFDPAAERRRDDLSAEALAMARPLGGRALVDALTARLIAIWRPGNAGERRLVADELVTVARAGHATEGEAFGHHVLTLTALERGDMAAARAQVEEGERCVHRLPLPHLTAQLVWTRAMLAALTGDFATAERLQDESYAATCRWSHVEAGRTLASQRAAMRWDQGRTDELEAPIRGFVTTLAPGVAALWEPVLALMLADGERLEEARAIFDRVAAADFSDVPVNSGRLFSIGARAETCVLLEDRPRARTLLDLLAPYRLDDILQPVRLVYGGPVAYHTGSLARVLGDHDAAVRDLEVALTAARRLGALPYVARSLVSLAAALRARGGPGDLGRAKGCADEALELAGGLGMARVAARAARLAAELVTGTGPGAPCR